MEGKMKCAIYYGIKNVKMEERVIPKIGSKDVVLIQELIFMEENLMVFLKDKNLDMKWLEELLKKVLMSQIVFN